MSKSTHTAGYELDPQLLRQALIFRCTRNDPTGVRAMRTSLVVGETYGRPESEGLDAIVRGMQLALPDDRTLTSHTDALYDGLYAYLSREVL